MERLDDLQLGNLKIYQDTEGFRFGIDSILLTEFAKDIKKNSRIVDLGTGTGVIGMLLCKKSNPKGVIGVEKQEEVCKLTQKSIEINNLQNIFKLINCDIKDLKLNKNYYDVVITNPPYKKAGTGVDANNEKKQISRFETTANLDDWIKVSSNLLNSQGSFYMVYRTERLAEVINTLNKYDLTLKKIRFVHSKIAEESKLMLIKAVKQGRPSAKVEPPLIIYDENGNYTKEVVEIYKNKNK